MHQVGVTLRRNEFFGGGRFAAGIERRARLGHRFWLKDVVFYAVILSRIRKVVLLPDTVENIEPFASAGVTIVVLFEADAIFVGFRGPPGGHDVECEAAVADAIDVGGLFGKKCGLMKRGANRDHEFDAFGDGGERGGCGPGVERRGFDAFDVVEIEFGDER